MNKDLLGQNPHSPVARFNLNNRNLTITFENRVTVILDLAHTNQTETVDLLLVCAETGQSISFDNYTGSGYRLRVTPDQLPEALEFIRQQITFRGRSTLSIWTWGTVASFLVCEILFADFTDPLDRTL